MPFGFMNALSMFFIYSFIGWMVEVIYYGLTEGQFINRGFLNGPICPIYGIAFYGVIAFLHPVSDSYPLLFFGSMLIATLAELIIGFLLLKIFGLRWWDYSEYKFNFHGYICPRFSIYWGIACTLGMKILHPAVLFILAMIPDVLQIVLLVILSVILVCDIVTTVMMINKLKQKIKIVSNISTEVRKFSDQFGAKLYDGVEAIVVKAQPTINSYDTVREMYTQHREVEKEIARRHRAKEREVLNMLMERELYKARKAGKSLSKSVKKKVSFFEHYEKYFVSRIKSIRGDINGMTLNYIKDSINNKDTIVPEDKTTDTIENRNDKKDNNDNK